MSVAKYSRTTRNLDLFGQLVPALALADPVAEPVAPRLRGLVDPALKLVEPPRHKAAVDVVRREVRGDRIEVAGDRPPQAPVVRRECRDSGPVQPRVVVRDLVLDEDRDRVANV